MKKTLLILSLNLLIFSYLIAQPYDFNVWESEQFLNSSTRNALGVKVYYTDMKSLSREWTNMLKEMGCKVKSRKEIVATNCSFEEASSNPFMIYTRLDQMNDSVVAIYSAIDLDGNYISSSLNPEAFGLFSHKLRNFAIDQTKNTLQKQISDAEKDITDNEKDFEKLESENQKLKNNIEVWKKQIEEAEKMISENEKAQIQKSHEIIEAKKKLSDLKSKLRQIY